MGGGQGSGGINQNRAKDKIALLEGRQDETRYPETWKTDLKSACCASPVYCAYATMCCYCASFQLRKRALHGDMTKYICCGGMWPCSGKMKEQDCPNFCLATEVWYCFAQSVATTRWMLQDEFRIKNTKCDNCIIGTMVALQYLACLCSCAACLASIFIGDVPGLNEAAQTVDIIADVVWCTVCGCMQTQAKVQLDLRDAGGNPHARPPMAPPTQAQMQIGHMQPHGLPAAPYGAPMQQGPPPGYPQAHHGAPPPGYPQAAAGRPPPGYPQAGGYAPPPPGAYPPPPPGAYPGHPVPNRF